MINTQTQIDSLIDLAVIQRTELKQLIESLPQLRDHLSSEIERNLEEIEPAIRSELEQFVAARALDTQAKTSAELTAKLDAMARNLESTTAAKYSVLMAERAENANLLAKAEARIEDAASMLSHAVKEIVTDELSRFPRAGEIDQLRKEFAEPRGLNPRGRWTPDETYQRLDLVTINGDSFVSNIDGNRERPSRTAGDWTLSAARGNGGGGGGATTLTDLVAVPSNGQLLIGNGSAFVNSTLTAGENITITNGPGSITIAAAGGSLAAFEDGTAAEPSIAFINELSTGVFRASTNVLGFAVGGTSRATMTNTGMTVAGTITPTGSVHGANGSAANPSLAFNSDQDTGLFRIGANNIGVAAGGAKVLDIATTGLDVTGTLSVSGAATLGAGAILNTPSSATLTNATGLPISTGVSGLGTGVATFLATPSSANLAAALTDETGTGANVFATSPTLTTPISATLTSPAGINLTLGLGTGGTALTLASSTLAATFAGTTAATNTTSGALQVAGGVGVAGAVIAGGTNNGTNEYSYPFLSSATTLGGFAAYSSGATANQRVWAIQHGSGVGDGVWRLRAINDALSNGSNAISITRTAEAIGTISLGTTTAIVSVLGTTAGASNSGALVVAGGISAGQSAQASYFGGAVTVGGAIYSNSFLDATGGVGTPAAGHAQFGGAGSYGAVITGYGSAYDFGLFNRSGVDVIHVATNTTTVAFSGAATFGGAVTAAVVTSTGAGYTNSGFQITNTSASRTIGFFLYNSGVTTIRDVTGAADLFAITTLGNATFVGTISPQQTGTPPTYVKGAIYFDTALNKLRVGGATGWETITSV